MTSKEALDKLFNFHICYGCTSYRESCKTCDYRLCYESVKSDLEVLGLLKKHLAIESEDDEKKQLGYSINCYLKSWLNCDKEEFKILKEWIENENDLFL